MTHATIPSALWIDLSPSLGAFHRPLLKQLARHRAIATWNYRQTADESGTLAAALALLDEYLDAIAQPVDLLGHGTSGLAGWLYARQHPERVRSLTLLGVGAQPAVNWHAHYYALRELLPCSRELVLGQVARSVFGAHPPLRAPHLVRCLQQDLDRAPSPHSLWERAAIAPAPVPAPLLVCGSADDVIVESPAMAAWEAYFKPGDRHWECPLGGHFFHFTYPHTVTAAIASFWRELPAAGTQPDSQAA